MRVAIAINRSWNIYNFRKGIVKSLLSDGHEVVAIAPRDEYSDRLVEWGCTFIPLEVSGTGINPFADISNILKFRSILKAQKIDILLTYTIKFNLYGTVASKFAGIPCICNVSGLGTVFLWRGLVSSIAKTLYSIIFRYSSYIFFQNDDDKRDFETLVHLDPKRTGLLPGSGINLLEFRHNPYKPGGSCVFLMISRLLVDKGIKEYIEAAKIVKGSFSSAEFRLVGGLDTRHQRSVSESELESWIDQGLVKYTPHNDNIKQAIIESDVVVLPSYREGTPRTLLEGGAIGRALIATDVPGCKHVVHDGENGLLCLPGDARDLSRKMISFIEMDAGQKIHMAQKSREIVENNFDEEIVIAQYRQIISKLTT